MKYQNLNQHITNMKYHTHIYAHTDTQKEAFGVKVAEYLFILVYLSPICWRLMRCWKA